MIRRRVNATASVALAWLALAFAGATTAFAQQADITVAKTGPDTAAPGANVVWTITALNTGPDAATLVQFDDTLPLDMTFVSLAQTTGPTMSCGTPAVGSGGAIQCTLDTMDAGATVTFVLTGNLPPAAASGAFYTNVATFTSFEDVTDENNGGATAVLVTGGLTPADLSVQKSAAGAAGADTDITYTITLLNAGPGSAANVVLTDTLPGTLTFVSFAQNTGPTMSCSTPAVGAGGTVTCTLASMPPGSASFTLVVHVPAATPAGTTFDNVATATSDNDPAEENGQGATTTAISSTDLSVTKTGPASANAGSDVAYSIIVSNAGPDTAINAVLSDVLPAPTTFVSIVRDSGPAATCATPPVGAGGTVSCTFASLGSGATTQFTVTVNTRNALTIANTATIAADTFDPNGEDNHSTANTSVVQSADVSIGKVANAPLASGAASYTITLANAGPSDAVNAAFNDPLPAGARYASLAQLTGPSATCTTPAVGANGVVSCTVASLAAGASAIFRLDVTFGREVDGQLVVNLVTATSATADPNSGNQTASAEVSVRVPAAVPVPLLPLPALALLVALVAMIGAGVVPVRSGAGVRRW